MQATFDTHSWSGYSASGFDNYTFNYGEFVQPGNTNSPCQSSLHPSEGAVWTGIGGATGGDLAQIGTDFGMDRDSGGTNGEMWYGFYDSLGGGYEAGSNLNVTASPKDIILTSVAHDGGRTYSMFIYDTTSNYAFDMNETAPSDWEADGSSDEFVVEATSYYDVFDNTVYAGSLPEFVSEKFDLDSVGVGSTTNFLDVWPHYPIDMVNSGTTNAAPGSLDSEGGFTDYYKVCN